MLPSIKNITLVCCVVLVAACRQPGPVELQDIDQQNRDLEVLSPEGFSSSNFEPNDSSGPHPAVPRNVYGRLLVEGMVVDGPQGRREISIAHAIFFDKSSPIVIDGDTIAFRSQDAGEMTVSMHRLSKQPKWFHHTRLSRDTVLGVEYMLMGGGGYGGRRFQYEGNNVYEWRAQGTTLFPAFTLSVTSAPEVVLTQPATLFQANVNEHLVMRWTGGGNSMKIIISSIERRLRPKPIFSAKIRQNKHGAVIPKKILQALPRDQQSFLVTIASETNEIRSIPNLPDPVLLQTSSSHSVMIRVVR